MHFYFFLFFFTLKTMYVEQHGGCDHLSFNPCDIIISPNFSYRLSFISVADTGCAVFIVLLIALLS